MSILVTGCAGFIGSHPADRMLERGEEVIGLDSFDEFYPRDVKEANLASAMDHRGFTLLEMDIRDRSRLTSIPESTDAILHLAARARVRPSSAGPVLYADVNLVGTSVLLDCEREASPPYVFASSSSVYGNNEKVPFSEEDSVDHPISP